MFEGPEEGPFFCVVFTGDLLKVLPIVHNGGMKFVFVFLFISLNVFAGNPYPRSPDLTLTPGSLCDTPDSHRYPEQIPYCERALNSFNKELIMIAYKKIGYSLSGERSQYKIDHFIPLCAGGSNKDDNLWPQYYTISKITDPLEALGCEVLAKGNIGQKELVELIQKAKLNLKETPSITKYLKSLRNRR